jgi:hypothetical protein
VKSIRSDKSADDCLDEEGFQELLELQRNSSSFNGHKKKKQIIPIEMNLKEDIKLSSLFKNLEFCIFSQNLSVEETIKQHDGKIVKNPTPKTNYILSLENVKIKNWISKNPSDHIDVIKFEWISDCVKKQSIVNLHPKYMIYTSKKTQLEFEKEMDEFDDYYKQEATITSLIHSMNKVKQLGKEEKSLSLIKQFKRNYLISQSWMKGLCVYFDRYKYVGDRNYPIEDSSLHFIELQFRSLGGDVYFKLSNEITHIIVEGNQNLRTFIFKCSNSKIVHIDWMKKCLQEQRLIPVDEFLISEDDIPRRKRKRE